MLTDRSHEQYARLFIYQRIKDVYNTLNATGDGEVDCTELQDYLTYLNFKATKKQVHDMVWEVDDSSEGVIRLDTIRKLLKRMQKAKVRGVGTGSNLLRTLIEYMMFDTDGSGGIEIEEVQQMFFIYYGYKGAELDLEIKDFQRLRKDPSQQIEFGEFLELMDKLDLKVAVQEEREPPPPRKPIVPSGKSPSKSPRKLSPLRSGATTHRELRQPTAAPGARTSRSLPPPRQRDMVRGLTPRDAGSRPGTRGTQGSRLQETAEEESFLPLLGRAGSRASVATNELFMFTGWKKDDASDQKEVMGAPTPHDKRKDLTIASMQERRFFKKSQKFMTEYKRELKMRQLKSEKAKEFSEPKMTISNALIKR